VGHVMHWDSSAPLQVEQDAWHLVQFLSVMKVFVGQVSTQMLSSRFKYLSEAQAVQ
jgi:hypothetical protein